MKKLIIIPILLLSLSVGATKYYIATTGDNGNDGSIGSPWATLSYACSQATTPGDTVYINAGTYNESAQIVKPLGVTITGTGRGSHIITTYTNVSGTQAAIQCASTAGTTTNDGGSLSYFRITGSSLTSSRAIYIGYRNNIAIDSVVIEDFLHGGIWMNTSNSTYPSLYSTGNSVTNCVINNASGRDGNFYPACIRITGQAECNILNNSFDMTMRAAGSNGNTIEFQRCKKTVIDGNTFRRLNHEITNWNFFFEGWDYAGDLRYTNNIHYGFGKVSFGGEFNKVDPDCAFGLECLGNRFINPTVGYRTVGGSATVLYAINLEGDGHTKATIARNYIQNYGVGIELSTPESGVGYWHHYWDWDSITVAYNIIDGVGYQDHAYAYGIWWLNETNLYPYYGVFNNVTIANNTIRAHDGATYDGYQGIGIYANDTVNNLRISNNITTGFSSYGIYISEHSTDTLVVTGLDVTYNCMNGNGTNTVYVESAAGRITITDSDVSTGNITTAPVYKSQSTYRLTESSPCVDAGIDVNVDYDYYGHKITGTPDIGAMEYGRYIMKIRE